MSEEKKNLTDEERKELKEKLKKQVDEMSDEELDNVAGGMPWKDGWTACVSLLVNVGEELRLRSLSDSFVLGGGECLVSKKMMNSCSWIREGCTVIDESTGKEYKMVGSFENSGKYVNADVIILKYRIGNSWIGIVDNSPISTNKKQMAFGN